MNAHTALLFRISDQYAAAGPAEIEYDVTSIYVKMDMSTIGYKFTLRARTPLASDPKALDCGLWTRTVVKSGGEGLI